MVAVRAANQAVTLYMPCRGEEGLIGAGLVVKCRLERCRRDEVLVLDPKTTTLQDTRTKTHLLALAAQQQAVPVPNHGSCIKGRRERPYQLRCQQA
jgi:hypothetical protein